MSIIQSIETEFSNIAGDSRSIMEKLEAVVGLQTKAKELTELEPLLTSIIEDTSKSTENKVVEILSRVGKL